MSLFWTSGADDEAKRIREAYEIWKKAQRDSPKLPKPPAPVIPWTEWDRLWAAKANIVLD